MLPSENGPLVLILKSYSQINTEKIGKYDLFIFITRGQRHLNFQTVYRGTRRKPNSSVQF